MLDTLLAKHPVEMMFLSLLPGLPIMFGAFTVSAIMQRMRENDQLSRGAMLLWSVVPGIGIGVCVLIFRLAASPYYHLEAGWSAYALSNPVEIIVPMLFGIGGVQVANNWARAAAGFVLVVVFLLFVHRFPTAPVFAALPFGELVMFNISVVVGCGLLGLGLFHTAALSYINRGIGALSACWGLAIIGFSIMSAYRPQSSIFHESPADISPLLLLVFTLTLFGAVVLAHVEYKRLRSSLFESQLLNDSEQRMRVLAEATQEAIVVERAGIVEDANRVFRVMVGQDNPVGHRLTTWLPAECSGRKRKVGQTGHRLVRCALQGPQGKDIPVELHTRAMGDGRMVYAMRDLTEANRKEERIRELAANDALTGIANRRSFDSALETAFALSHAPHSGRTKARYLALVMIDLDRFKPVNDTYGHAVGDKLLRAIAHRFRNALRPDDILARIGGDEFALITWVKDEHSGAALAGRLCKAAGEPFDVDGVTLNIGASAGFVLYGGEADPDTVEMLKQYADIALYRAKARGRGRAVAFRAEMRQAVSERLQLEEDVRQAQARNELVLHYQPQHDVRSGAVNGYRTVLNWTHGEHGLVSASTFTTLADETGAIIPIGRWAMNRAMTEFATLQTSARLTIAVSPVQIAASDLVDDVRHALDNSGFDPERLELEVTENVLFQKGAVTLRALQDLRSMGVNLSLGGFGASYTSLACTKQFPFTKICIDGTFIEAMMKQERARTLVQSTIALAKALELRVAADGVQTHGQLLQLAQQACDEAQGQLLGPPLAINDLLAQTEPAPNREPADARQPLKRVG